MCHCYKFLYGEPHPVPLPMPRQRTPTGLVEVNASQDDGYEPKDDQRPLRRSIQRLGMEEGLADRIADVKDRNPQEEDETNASHNDQSPRCPGVKVPTEGRNVVQETRTAHQEREHHDHQHEEHQGQHRKRNHAHQHHDELQHETDDLHKQVRQLLEEITWLVGLEACRTGGTRAYGSPPTRTRR